MLRVFRISSNCGTTLYLCFNAIPGAKPVPTFAGIALVPNVQDVASQIASQPHISTVAMKPSMNSGRRKSSLLLVMWT